MKNDPKVQTIAALLKKMTDDFCGQFLDEEYKNLSHKLIDKLSRKHHVPFLRGKIEIWASAVIYALGQINFLFDKSFKPFATADDITNFFSTTKSATSQKAKLIRDMFKMNYYDKEFSTEHLKKNNPFNDLVMVNGLIVPKNYIKS